MKKNQENHCSRKSNQQQQSQQRLKINSNLQNYEACFSGDTNVRLWGNKKVLIKELLLGDRLVDGSYVTALIKSSSYGQSFYNINNIIVTGNHKILYDERLIPVNQHPDSIELPDYYTEYVYCINTTSKKICINGLIFSDWDDLDDYDMFELKIKTLKDLTTPITPNTVHKFLDGGFDKDTLIELEDGRSVKISDICVNDVLRFGENVLAIVKIDGAGLSSVKHFKVNNNNFIGGPNLLYLSDNMGIKKTVKLNEMKTDCNALSKCEQPEILYHLITDKSTFYINGVCFYDYNGCIEYFLDSDNKDLFQKIIF